MRDRFLEPHHGHATSRAPFFAGFVDEEARITKEADNECLNQVCLRFRGLMQWISDVVDRQHPASRNTDVEDRVFWHKLEEDQVNADMQTAQIARQSICVIVLENSTLVDGVGLLIMDVAALKEGDVFVHDVMLRRRVFGSESTLLS